MKYYKNIKLALIPSLLLIISPVSNSEEFKILFQNDTPFSLPQYNENGFDKNGIHKDTGTEFNPEGYNISGFDSNGYDSNGFDSNGYDIDGYDSNEFNASGQGKEICYTAQQGPWGTKETSNYTRYTVSYAHANSTGTLQWSRLYIWSPSSGSVGEGNDSYSNYGYTYGSYRVPQGDARWGYRQGNGSITTRDNSSGYQIVYGICRKRLALNATDLLF